MFEAFRLGGWGMYPTAIAGALLLGAAIRFARSPDPARLPLVRSLSILVALVGALGFTSGVIHCFTACADAPANELPMWVVAGTGESLCNVALALVALVAGRVATSVGHHRAARTGAQLVDPHAR
jgi:hypothetical protein